MDGPIYAEAERIFRQICDEALENRRPDRFDGAASPYQLQERDRPAPAASPRWLKLQHEPVELQIAVAFVAHALAKVRPWPNWLAMQAEDTAEQIVTLSLERKLPFSSAQMLPLLQSWLKEPLSFRDGTSARALLSAVERLAQGKAVAEELRPVLTAIRAQLLDRIWGEERKFGFELSERIERLLTPLAMGARPLPSGSVAQALRGWMETLPKGESEVWLDLAVHCAAAGDNTKPSGKWQKTAKSIIEKIDASQFVERLSQSMRETTPHPLHPDHSHNILKGMLWAAGVSKNGSLVGEIGRFGEKCYQKVPEIGARSGSLGNAAIRSLAAMVGEPRAAAELFRLRGKIKYGSARRLISACLADLALKTGCTIEEMEDFSLPFYGLDGESRLTARFGSAWVELSVTPTGTMQQWFNASGKRVKGPPADARAAEGFAAYRRSAKDIEAATQGQALRLEQAWIEERSWAISDWEKHFLSHPLRGPIVGALIWQIGDTAVMLEAGAFKDVAGRSRSFDPHDRVRLWHPLDADPGQVLAWRARVLESGMTQPIKQAHREIYVLTDAERTTHTYSNRFAAHILRRHPLRALCQVRGWKYTLSQGFDGWDDWNVPTRALPKQRMKVEYNVEMVDQHLGHEALHVASDQVRFLDAHGGPVALDEVAPTVFSEVMRDVDLFVAVASVANDPAWTDGGPAGRHRNYWQEWAFGDLGQSAATRKELIASLAPKLSIADRLEINGRFLLVQGRRQKYAIHFGSGNIQILPSNRYLCIVPDRSPQEAASVKLPFAGDGVLSVILAKAFLLVDESQIKDESILRQL
jgi:Domain of unknown function (DUF4132)